MREKTFSEMAKSLRLIAKNYFTAQRYLRARICGFSSGDEATINAHQKFISRVHRAYDELADDEKEFINNDFFYDNYPKWWVDRYSVSSYYRHKKTIMRKFLEKLEDD